MDDKFTTVWMKNIDYSFNVYCSRASTAQNYVFTLIYI